MAIGRDAPAGEPVTTITTTEAPSTAPSTNPPTTGPAPTTTPPSVETTPPVPRAVAEPRSSAFATWGDLVLLHPSDRVERVAFHQSNHEGARQLEITDTAVNPMVLESRGRSSGLQSAADVVIDPGLEVRTPVSGRVLRSGGFTLYCDITDHFVVIEPHGHPGFELKVLHVADLLVSAGQEVVAGETPIASAPTQQPFRSQVDDHTAEPSWPHVHIELVDTSIPNISNPNSGSEDC